MSLVAFGFERYRSFAAPTRIELGKRITLLYGYNNAGKSALLRGLVLVAASCSSRKQGDESPLEMDHEAALGAPFADLVSRQSPGPLGISLEWDDADVHYGLREILRAADREGPVIVERFETNSPSTTAEWLPNDDRRPEYSVDGASRELRFRGLLPENEAFAGLRARLTSLGEDVWWLGAARADRPRRQTPSPKSFIAHDGQGYVQTLHREGPDSPVTKFVREALRRIASVDLAVSSDAGGLFVEFSPPHNLNVRVPVSAVGEGIVHVLPVLTLAALARHRDAVTGPILAIEQPELHLHPRAEVELVDALIGASDGGARFLLETHSEALLLGLQLAVADRRIESDDVRIYWVETDARGDGKARRVTLDREGRREDWPPGVFSESLEQARRLVLRRGGVGE